MTRAVMNHVYSGSTFSFFIYYISYASKAGRKEQSGNLMDMTRCNLGKFLVVPTFVARRLQVRKDAREPSGESWNYLSRRQSCNFAENPLLSNLEICFFLQIYKKWATPTLKLSVMNVYSKHDLRQTT